MEHQKQHFSNEEKCPISPNITSPIHRVLDVLGSVPEGFSNFPMIFPAFANSINFLKGELNCVLDSCNATDEVPVGYAGEAYGMRAKIGRSNG